MTDSPRSATWSSGPPATTCPAPPGSMWRWSRSKGKAAARATVRLTELFDRVVRYRNGELGHGAAGQRPGPVLRADGRCAAGRRGRGDRALDVLAGRRLVYVGEVRRLSSGDWLVERYELVGEAPKRIESLRSPRAGRPRCRVPIASMSRGGLGAQTGVRIGSCLSPLIHVELESERSTSSTRGAGGGRRSTSATTTASSSSATWTPSTASCWRGS